MSSSPVPRVIPVHPRQSVLKSAVLWTLTILLAASAMIYQRSTGPTYELKGDFVIEGKEYPYELIRSQETTETGKTPQGAPVKIPDPGPEVSATLYFKRFRTNDEFTAVPMTKDDEDTKHLVGRLEEQPAAGKIEYYIELEHNGQTQRIPEGTENVVLRYKDPVPTAVLAPHVTMMIFTIIFGIRAGLGALVAPISMRLYAWLAFACMTVGGMVLGPIVQKYAFGEYWTGFPWGGDWTDNKMLVMWICWLLACSVIGFSIRKKEGFGRVMVIAAALSMTVVYLIPHSMGGSELDYQKLDEVTDPKDAIRTGKQ